MIAKAIADYMRENEIEPAFIREQTGLTKHRVSRIFTGKRRLSVDEYVLICNALRVGYDFFFQAQGSQSA